MRRTAISLSQREREGAREAKPSGKGEGDARTSPITLILPPPDGGSLLLPMGEGI